MKYPFIVTDGIFGAEYQRSYPTLAKAESAAHRRTDKENEPSYIMQIIDDTREHIASVRKDALDRIWTDVEPAGVTLL